ncbi:MAG: NAD-dependent epimerase/dehydratase family protein [Polymorphobacter sp.]
MQRRLLITGESGFIGTNVLDWAQAQGWAVINLDSVPPRNPAQAGLFRRVDICDRAALQAAFDDFAPDDVIHLAARTDLLGQNLDDYAANTTGTANLLAVLATQPQVRRTLFASSMLVCRLGYIPSGVTDYAPNTPYGASKVESERLVRAADPERRRIILFRPTSIWGPWFGEPYRNFFDAVVAGIYVHPAGGSTRRSYGYIDNAVAQIAALLDAPETALGDELYHLADYAPVDIGAWADMIAAASGRRRPLRIPMPAAKAAALAGDGLQLLGWKRPPMTSFRLSNMRMNAVQDTGPMAALCPDLPVSIGEGVSRTVAWMAQHRR